MAGKTITLTAADGHKFEAYQAIPAEAPLGAVVILQEVFGVNHHIRAVVDQYAGLGYVAIAPALFDRVERKVALGYTADDLAHGREIAYAMGWDNPLLDTQASMAAAAEKAGTGKKAAVVGYCWGGSLAWLAACRLKPSAAVGYYGGKIGEHKDEDPNCPVMLHFGKQDPHIPAEVAREVERAHPDIAVFLYDAGHGFNCTERADYDEGAASLALDRTTAFLSDHLG